MGKVRLGLVGILHVFYENIFLFPIVHAHGHVHAHVHVEHVECNGFNIGAGHCSSRFARGERRAVAVLTHNSYLYSKRFAGDG